MRRSKSRRKTAHRPAFVSLIRKPISRCRRIRHHCLCGRAVTHHRHTAFATREPEDSWTDQRIETDRNLAVIREVARSARCCAVMPSGNRRWITPIIMLMAGPGIVAGALIISSVTQQHVQLDDGTVWITSLKDRKAARFNVRQRHRRGHLLIRGTVRHGPAQRRHRDSGGTRPAISRPPPSARTATPPSRRICRR